MVIDKDYKLFCKSYYEAAEKAADMTVAVHIKRAH